jgi:hypothetical protein
MPNGKGCAAILCEMRAERTWAFVVAAALAGLTPNVARAQEKPSSDEGPKPDEELDEKTGLPRYSVLTSAAIVRTVEPWSDPDPYYAPRRYGIGDYGFRAGAEYRANWLHISPLSINGSSGENADWIEHRLRVDGAVDWKEKVRLVFSADMLDGVLWGDNGDFGGNPASNAGTNVATRNPNTTRPASGRRGPIPSTASRTATRCAGRTASSSAARMRRSSSRSACCAWVGSR